MSPIEWLNRLIERPDEYRALVEASGGFAGAAWKLAEARCRASEVATTVPSRSELRAAAYQLARRLGDEVRVPPSGQLARDCERLGLLVI